MGQSDIVTVVVPFGGALADLRTQLLALRRAAARVEPGSVELVVSCNRVGGARQVEALIAELRMSEYARAADSSAVVGPGHARNAGAACARGAHLLFCDADDEVDEDWISSMRHHLAESELVAGALRFGRLNSPAVSAWRERQSPAIGSGKFHHLPFAPAANLGITRGLFLRIGGFDEELRVGEDVDLCWRAQYLGARLAFAEDAVVQYRLKRSLRSTLTWAASYGRGDAALLQKHRPHGARRTVKDSLRAVAGVLVLSGLAVLRPDERPRLAYSAGMLWGRVVGSVRLRTWAI